MRGYGAFAWYYDELTENVSYQKRADYFLQLIEKFGSSGPIVLDLACGTGSLSMELAQRGCDVIGVDASEDMLSVAQEKAMEHPEWDILYLCQSMTELDLFGTVDTTICALDSETLQSLGISFRKADYILDFAHKVCSGEFDLDALVTLDDQAFIEQLITLRGIGTWTAEMLLTFCLQRPDVLLEVAQLLSRARHE